MSSSSSASSSGSSPVATFFETIWGIVVRPTETTRDLVERRPVVQGLIVLIAVGLFDGLARFIATGAEVAAYFGIESLVGGLITPGWAVIVIVANVLIAALFWVASRLLGGNASFPAILSGVCFIYSIFILNNLIRLALSPFLDIQPLVAVGALVGIAMFMWQFILHVILVSEANGFSTARSLAAVIIPEFVIWGIFSGFLSVVLSGIIDRFG